MLSQKEKFKNQKAATFLTFDFIHLYSVLKLFTGLAIAAFIAWKLTVSNVIKRAPNAETTKTHIEMSVL